MSSKLITEKRKEKTQARHPKLLFFVKILILLTANLGCQTEIQTVQESRVLMDTMVAIHVYAAKPADEPAIRRAMAAAFAEMSRLDSLLSAYRRDSEVAAINQNAAAVNVLVSSDMDSVLQMAQWAAQISNGAFDVTIAPVLRLWGFGTDSLGLPAPEKIAARLPLVNAQNLVVSDERNSPQRSVHFRRQNMAIDLGGVAKGYVVDRGLALLVQAGWRDAMITAGGDLRAVASPLTAGRRYIWIQHPRAADSDSTQNQTGAFWGRFKLDAGAVSTSGDYERFFFKDGKRFHHIIDPCTGYPARHAVSATVIARRAVAADALSTTLFVLGPERGIALADSLPEVDAVIIYADGEKLKWRVTKALKNKLEVLHQ
jgi:thiamine biosynthesis lipoprotein